MKTDWKIKPIIMWETEYDRRTFPTVRGAVEAYADEIALSIWWKFEKKKRKQKKNWDQDKETKRMKKKAIRRLIPIFEKMYAEEYNGFYGRKEK